MNNGEHKVSEEGIKNRSMIWDKMMPTWFEYQVLNFTLNSRMGFISARDMKMIFRQNPVTMQYFTRRIVESVYTFPLFFAFLKHKRHKT